MTFFTDSPLLVKQGLLEYSRVWVKHFGDIKFIQKIADVKNLHPLFAKEYEFMDFKDNYLFTKQEEKDLNEMIMTSKPYKEIMTLSVRIFFFKFHEKRIQSVSGA